jgi:hypothetical protein
MSPQRPSSLHTHTSSRRFGPDAYESINPTIYGVQFQQGTRWNAGLSDELLAEYERVLTVGFPHDLKAFLRELNGTDLPTLNLYGSSGEPHRKSVGVYSYPRDIEIVKQRIEETHANRAEIAADLAGQGFELPVGGNSGARSFRIDTSEYRSTIVTIFRLWSAPTHSQPKSPSRRIRMMRNS